MRSSRRFPSLSVGRPGRLKRISTGFIPHFLAAADSCRHQLDCSPAQVMMQSEFLDKASASTYSSLRTLLPPMARPVWSSRFTKSLIPKLEESAGSDSNGVGRSASEHLGKQSRMLASDFELAAVTGI